MWTFLGIRIESPGFAMAITADCIKPEAPLTPKKHPFAIEMVNSFLANWPNEIKLIAFVENAELLDNKNFKDKLIIKDFHKEIPEYNLFCEKFAHKKKYTDSFKFNAFRFAYKVYAIKKSLSYNKSKYLIWLDSDIKTHTKIIFDQQNVNRKKSLSKPNTVFNHFIIVQCFLPILYLLALEEKA